MLKASVKTFLLISSSCVKNREKSLRHVATEAKFVFAQIWQFLLAELFEYSPMHDCSDLRNKTVSSPFATLENTITILLSPPKMLHNHCFQFLLGFRIVPKETETTMVMQSVFLRDRKIITVFSKVANTFLP